MLKIVHTSDLGLKNWSWGGLDPTTGLNKGFLDALRAFKYVVDGAIKSKAKYMIIAGDLNEERSPEPLLVEKFCEQIRRLVDSKIITIIVAGNHDLDGSLGASTSISYLKALQMDYVYVCDLEATDFEFEDVKFHCLPYFTKNQLGHKDNKELQKYLDNWIKNVEMSEDLPNILVSHYSVETSFYGLEIDEIRLKFDLMKKFDYVALGHIHKYEMFNKHGVNGGYCGSPYIKDFGENFNKYYNLIEFKNQKCSVNKVEIPSREYVQIDVDATEAGLEEVLNLLKENFEDKLKDKTVKVRIKTFTRFNPKPIYEFLRSQEVFHYVPIHWDVVQSDRKLKLSATSDMNDVEVVKEYLESVKIDKSWKPKLLDIHSELSE